MVSLYYLLGRRDFCGLFNLKKTLVKKELNFDSNFRKLFRNDFLKQITMLSSASSEKDFIQKLTKAIDAHLDDEHFGVSELAAELGMSRVTLHRKVKEIVKKSVSTFIREIRLKRAYDLLLKKSFTVSEVAYKVGFSSASYFNTRFHDFYGFPPGDVLKGNHKTTETSKILERKKRKLKSNLAIYIVVGLFLIVAGYILYQTIINTNVPKVKIAILPPKNLDSTPQNSGISELLRENVHADLNQISNLGVIPGRDMERFRDSKKSNRKIAKEVNADYVLELKIYFSEPNSFIIVELNSPKIDETFYSKRLEPDQIDEVSIFDISLDIAVKVADTLQTKITTKELDKIKIKSTKNRTALSHYHRGLYHNSFLKTKREYEHMIGAKNEFLNAVKEDSTFGDAWLKLAKHYIGQSWYNMPNLFEMEQLDLKAYNIKLDSGKMMLDNAIKFGVSDQDELFTVQSYYYFDIGDFETSDNIWKEMWRKKKKDANYYLSLSAYCANRCEYYEAVKYRLKYLELVPDTSFIEVGTYRGFVALLGYLTDLPDYAKVFTEIKYKQDKQRQSYNMLQIPAMSGGNYEVLTSFVLKNYNDSYVWLQELDSLSKLNKRKRTPYAYSVWLYDHFGEKEKSKIEYYKILQNSVALSDTVFIPYSQKQRVYFQLSAIYAYLGQKEKAYECLTRLSSLNTVPAFLLRNIEEIPHYDDMRNEQQFQDILRDLQIKHKKEHDRIEKLLNAKMDKIRKKLS